MRTIQKLTVAAYDAQKNRVREVKITLPKDSRILCIEKTTLNFVIWYEGDVAEGGNRIGFEQHRLGIFAPEDPLPLTAIRFHSRVADSYQLFLYEFIIA